MEIINNRYRVISPKRHNHMISSYIVYDMLADYEILELNILNSEYLSENLTGIFSSDFIAYSGIISSGIIKDYDFDLIDLIDNKKINEKQYFYTCKHYDNEIEFYRFVQKAEEDELLDVFVQILKAVNFIHLKGLSYGTLNPENIYIYNENGKNIVRLKDYASVQLEKYDYWGINSKYIYYLPSEALSEKKQNNLSDIYSLGVLLLEMCVGDRLGAFQQSIEEIFNKEISQINSERSKHFLDKLKPVIKGMISANIENRYSDIGTIIDSINKAFGSSYVHFNIGEVEKLSFYNKICGRDYEINKVINIYEQLKNHESDGKIIMIHGEAGIGKTRFLKEMKYIFKIKKAKLYYSFSLDSSSNNRSKASVDILKRLIAESEMSLIKKYEAELSVFIPEILNSSKSNINEMFIGEKGKLRVLNGIFSFINEFANNNPIVFIIDNLHYADDFTTELLEFLYARQQNNNNIMLIFSYSDTEAAGNRKFINVIKRINNSSGVLDMVLRELSIDDSAEMVKNILGARNLYKKFSSRIYSLTYGNPLFIQEVLKNLFSKKIIFIDPFNGVWDSNYNEDYNELPLPLNMEQAVLNQIKEIDESYYLILNAVSIFNEGVSIEIIMEFISDRIDDLENKILDLINRGLLCKKIEDRGFVYDFYNKVLKNLIYSRFNEFEKETMHRKAAEILERHYDKSREDNEEIIFHLEKSGNKEKVIKYCIENAEIMESKRNRDGAVKNLKKAVSMFDNASTDNRKMGILIKIGDIYYEEGNLTQSIEAYGYAEDIAVKADEKSIIIDCLNKIAEAYYDKNDIRNAESFIKKVEGILKSYKYMQGYLACMRMKSRLLSKKQEYKKAYELIRMSLDICPDEYSQLKGAFYHNLGNVYIETGRIDEALKSYEECIVFFKDTNYVKGIINALNNIGVIYADFYQDEKKALEYFLKIKELIERNNFISPQPHNLVNIGEMYYDCWDYELSYKYFKEGLELSIRTESESSVFYCYNYLSNLSLKLNKYAEAYEYYCLAKKELESYPEHGKEIGVHYQIAAELFMELGKADIARDYIDKACELYKNDDSKIELDCKIIRDYLNIMNSSSDNIGNCIYRIKDYIKKYSSNFKKMDVLYRLCMILIDSGNTHIAADVFRYAEKLYVEDLPDVISLKRYYIMGVLEHGEGKIKTLNTALDISKNYNKLMLSWKIFYSIGDLYYSRKNYYYAVNYYFEACEIIRNLILQIPDELKLDFISFNHMLKPYNRIFSFKIKSTSEDKIIENELSVNNLNDVERIIEYKDFTDILENKLFIKSAKKIYKNELPENIRNVNDIVTNLSSNAVENLELISKYISSITLASNVMIILDNFEKGYFPIASSAGRSDLPENRYVLDMAKALKAPEIMNDSRFDKNYKELNYISNRVKASMCIPIIAKDKIQRDEYLKDRRKRGTDKLRIKGYLYMESDRILNNFNEESMEKCFELSGLIGLMIDKYQLKISSTVDKLTGTLTRKALEDTITGLIENSSKSGSCFSILMFDLDHFKNINDRFGHQMGDTTLKRVCEIAMENIRSEDICGRYGGEEFIIALPDVEYEEANNIAEKIRTKIEEDKILGDKLPVTISIGIALFPQHGQWKQELIEKADQALYVAKELGRNRSQVWSSEFSSHKKSTNKLTGIISGNVVQDSRNVLVIAELIELIKSSMSCDNKIFNALGRIIEITEAQNGTFFLIEDDKIIEKYGRRIFIDEWTEVKNFNMDIINSVISKKQGLYMIDWDEIAGYDTITGIPDWHSIIAVPAIISDTVKGVLCLTVSTKVKEFKFDDFNFVGTLGELMAAII